jgi:hypothetical protein
MPLTAKYRQAKRLSRSRRGRGKPLYQAVFVPVLTSRRAETATADCIKDGVFIDPPYNTGNEGWVYNDNVNDPKIKKWLGEVVGKEGEDLSRHDKWLCMMYPRLRLLQKLLADDGAIFISIGDDAVSNLKAICSEIFGSSTFVANQAGTCKDNRRVSGELR